MSTYELKESMLIILRAARILLQNGAETYRVEDTIRWLGYRLGVEVHSFVIPTGIFVTIEDDCRNSITRVRSVSGRGFDLKKLTDVNDFSRKYDFSVNSFEDAMDNLDNIDKRTDAYPTMLVFIAASIASGGFAYLFGGTMLDALVAFVAGFFAQLASAVVSKNRMHRFSSAFVGGLVVAGMAIFFGSWMPEINADKVIIGSVMPFAPGIAFTNAARDLVTDHLLSGMARFGESAIIAIAIAAGVAVKFFI